MGKTKQRLKAIAAAAGLALLTAFCLGCALEESGPSKASHSFKKEVQETADSLAPFLIDAVSNRDPRAVHLILEGRSAVAREKGRPYTCGITVLDLNGILLASITPGETFRRLHYSRYEAAMQAIENNRIFSEKLYLQDRTILYVVAIPLAREGKAQGLLVLTFDARDVKKRIGISEKEFLSLDLNR